MSKSTYVKVSTQITEHPKMLRVPRAHRWVYIEVLCYCARNLTDGFIPAEYVRRNCDDDELLSLIDAGFIHHAPGGYLIHDYLDWQTPRATIEAKREAGRRGGKRSGDVRRSKTEAPASRLLRQSDELDIEVEVEEQELLLTADAVSDTKPSDFETFWDSYPRKVGKRKAQQAFKAALTRASAYLIIGGALQYRDDPNREAAYTAHPTTWLNRDGWNDDPLPPREQPPPGDPPQRPTPIPPTFDAAALRPADPIPMPDNIRQFKGASA